MKVLIFILAITSALSYFFFLKNSHIRPDKEVHARTLKNFNRERKIKALDELQDVYQSANKHNPAITSIYRKKTVKDQIGQVFADLSESTDYIDLKESLDQENNGWIELNHVVQQSRGQVNISSIVSNRTTDDEDIENELEAAGNALIMTPSNQNFNEHDYIPEKEQHE